MSELKDRIKMVRKQLKLTQKEFGEMIGVSQNSVANYEIGYRNPSAAVINNICKTFNVSYDWLKLGDDTMPAFEYMSARSEIDMYVDRLFSSEDTIAQRAIISILKAYYMLDNNGKEVVRSSIKQFAKDIRKDELGIKSFSSKDGDFEFGFLFSDEESNQSDAESNENDTKTEEN